MHASTILIGAVLGAAFLSGLPADASASFSKPRKRATFGAQAFSTETTNDRGDRALVSGSYDPRRLGRVRLARRGGQYGRSQTIPGSRGGHQYAVAVGPRGEVIVAWKSFEEVWQSEDDIALRDEGCCLTLEAAIYRPGRGWSAAKKLWPRAIDFRSPIVVAIRDAEHFGVVAEGYQIRPDVYPHEIRQGLYARFSKSRGGWGPPERYELGKRVQPRALTLTRAGARVVYERWLDYDGNRGFLERTRSPSGRLSDARSLGVTTRGGVAAIDHDARGGLALAWYEPARDGWEFHVGTADVGEPLEQGAEPSDTPEYPYPPVVDVDIASNGAALVVWMRDKEALVAERQPGDTFGEFRHLANVDRKPQGYTDYPIRAGIAPDGRWFAIAGRHYRSLTAYAGEPGRDADSEIEIRNRRLSATGPLIVDARGRATFSYITDEGLFEVRGR